LQNSFIANQNSKVCNIYIYVHGKKKQVVCRFHHLFCGECIKLKSLNLLNQMKTHLFQYYTYKNEQIIFFECLKDLKTNEDNTFEEFFNTLNMTEEMYV